MVEVREIHFGFNKAFAPDHAKDMDYKSNYFELADLDWKKELKSE